MSELLTVRDVATVLKCSDDAVVKRFAKMPGVIDLGKAETRNRRQYRVLRIPKTVVEKYLADKSGRPIQIQIPERAETAAPFTEMGGQSNYQSRESGVKERCNEQDG